MVYLCITIPICRYAGLSAIIYKYTNLLLNRYTNIPLYTTTWGAKQQSTDLRSSRARSRRPPRQLAPAVAETRSVRRWRYGAPQRRREFFACARAQMGVRMYSARFPCCLSVGAELKKRRGIRSKAFCRGAIGPKPVPRLRSLPPDFQ